MGTWRCAKECDQTGREGIQVEQTGEISKCSAIGNAFFVPSPGLSSQVRGGESATEDITVGLIILPFAFKAIEMQERQTEKS